jgi:hypothetical protein
VVTTVLVGRRGDVGDVVSAPSGPEDGAVVPAVEDADGSSVDPLLEAGEVVPTDGVSDPPRWTCQTTAVAATTTATTARAAGRPRRRGRR